MCSCRQGLAGLGLMIYKSLEKGTLNMLDCTNDGYMATKRISDSIRMNFRTGKTRLRIRMKVGLW